MFGSRVGFSGTAQVAHGSSVVENSLRLYYFVINVCGAPPTVVKNVAFVCTTIILYSIGLTGTH